MAILLVQLSERRQRNVNKLNVSKTCTVWNAGYEGLEHTKCPERCSRRLSSCGARGKSSSLQRGRREFKVGTTKPVNFLLGGGQEVEEINAIESSQRMRGRDGSGGGKERVGRRARRLEEGQLGHH